MNYPAPALEFGSMLKLPRGHSESDLELARRVARQLGSGDLHVFWSDSLPSPRLRPPALPSLAEGLAVVGGALGALASAFNARRPRPQRPLT